MDVEELVQAIGFSASENIATSLANRLTEMIIANELPQNYVFPGEPALCEKLGIGRGTLREAYKILESSGYITKSRRGTMVNPQSSVIQAMPFSAAIELANYKDLLEFRSIFESEIARLAALRADEAHIINLEYYLAMMKVFVADHAELTYYDMRFHQELAKATQNGLLITTMEMATPSFCDGIRQAFMIDTERNIQSALESHRNILAAVKMRDAQKAWAEMNEHIRNICELSWET